MKVFFACGHDTVKADGIAAMLLLSPSLRVGGSFHDPDWSRRIRGRPRSRPQLVRWPERARNRSTEL